MVRSNDQEIGAGQQRVIVEDRELDLGMRSAAVRVVIQPTVRPVVDDAVAGVPGVGALMKRTGWQGAGRDGGEDRMLQNDPGEA